MSNPKVLWTPETSFTEASNMNAFKKWVNSKHELQLEDYQDLWNWSVNENEKFWESILKFFKVQYSGNYTAVKNYPEEMIDTKWFEGIHLSYAEQAFSNYSSDTPALIFKSETHKHQEISWATLKEKTAKIAQYLKENGVSKGDRVCAMLPNSPEAVISFLAVNSIGAVWSCCSPDFGTKSIIDRFEQIEPKVFISTNGHTYNGRIFNKLEDITSIKNSIKSIRKTLLIDYLPKLESNLEFDSWNNTINGPSYDLTFERVPFAHPIWVLYSSGTTGRPKPITHSTGGTLLEQLKALSLHQNIKKKDKFFWYSTTGWMMWNYATSALLVGGTVSIYDGSPAFPSADVLWEFAEESNITHFGAGASYYIYCMKEGMDFTKNEKINNIQSFGSTGSPLPPEAFEWFYEKVNPNAWVISLSGGTDICSGFVGGNPFEAVYEGEIQCRMLGVNLKAYNESAESVTNELGEMVIETAMPSMPIYFWGDTNNERYRSSYFEMYPGTWRHGDWIKITDRNTLIIYGRSDATLNRGGVRIGTSEVYSATESVDEVVDSLVVCLDHNDGTQTLPLFVKLKEGITLDIKLKRKIKKIIKTQFSPRHIPDKIYQVQQIPYTISGKKMEAPVKKVLSGTPVEKAASKDAMKNPEALEFFVGFELD